MEMEMSKKKERKMLQVKQKNEIQNQIEIVGGVGPFSLLFLLFLFIRVSLNSTNVYE